MTAAEKAQAKKVAKAYREKVRELDGRSEQLGRSSDPRFGDALWQGRNRS